MTPTYTLSELEDVECRKDQALVGELKSTLQRLRRKAHRLRLLGSETSAAGSSSCSPVAEDDGVKRAAFYIPTADFNSAEDEEMWKNESDEDDEFPTGDDACCIRIDRSEYEQIMDTLKPYGGSASSHNIGWAYSAARGHHRYLDLSGTSAPIASLPHRSLVKSMSATTMSSSSTADDTSEVGTAAGSSLSLVDMAKTTVAELERWKRRACRLSAEVRRMETGDKNEDGAATRSERLPSATAAAAAAHAPEAGTKSAASERTRRVSMPFGYQYPKQVKMSPSSSQSQIIDESTTSLATTGQHHKAVSAAPSGSGGEKQTPLLGRRRTVQQPQQQPFHLQATTSVDRIRKLSLVGQHPMLKPVVT